MKFTSEEVYHLYSVFAPRSQQELIRLAVDMAAECGYLSDQRCRERCRLHSSKLPVNVSEEHQLAKILLRMRKGDHQALGKACSAVNQQRPGVISNMALW